ncbi:MAG: hypothetical protein AB7D51_07285 [Desulfovibrionaceae bacterium]
MGGYARINQLWQRHPALLGMLGLVLGALGLWFTCFPPQASEESRAVEAVRSKADLAYRLNAGFAEAQLASLALAVVALSEQGGDILVTTLQNEDGERIETVHRRKLSGLLQAASFARVDDGMLLFYGCVLELSGSSGTRRVMVDDGALREAEASLPELLNALDRSDITIEGTDFEVNDGVVAIVTTVRDKASGATAKGRATARQE